MALIAKTIFGISEDVQNMLNDTFTKNCPKSKTHPHDKKDIIYIPALESLFDLNGSDRYESITRTELAKLVLP